MSRPWLAVSAKAKRSPNKTGKKNIIRADYDYEFFFFFFLLSDAKSMAAVR